MKVFIDMDGVIADYFTAIEKLMKVEHYSHAKFEDVVQSIIDWDSVARIKRSWLFSELEVLPNAEKLINEVVGMFGEYSILTTPLRGYEMPSIMGKVYWIEKQLSIKPSSIIFTDTKAQYARPDRILIDDYRCNINNWEAAGGVGIKYKALSKNYSIDDVIIRLRNYI